MSQNLQPLGQLVSASAFPEEIQFLATPISSLLNNFLVVEYQHQSSSEFNSISVFLVLRTTADLSFEIPGTGFRLILNPGITPPGALIATDFPINVNVNFKDQGLWQEFDLTSFSNGYREVYDRLIDYYDLSENYILERILNLNYTDSVDLLTAINNAYAGVNLSTIITTTDPIATQIEEVITRIGVDMGLQAIPAFVYDVAFELQINSQPLAEQWDKMQELFKFQLNEASAKDFILKNLLPEFNASLNLSAGLEFPRAILIPMEKDGNGKYVEVGTPAKFKLDFDIGDLYFSSEGGFGFNELYVAHLDPYPKAKIGKTGIIISFDNARLDLSKKTNIPEAAIEGRPNDFVGVFIDKATIELPDKLLPGSGSNAIIVGKNLLIGTGGLSGALGLELKSTTSGTPDPFIDIPIGSDMSLKINTFSLTFQQNRIIGSEILGTFILPDNLKKEGTTDPAEIDVRAAFLENGDFKLSFSDSEGYDIEIPKVCTIRIYKLELGDVDGRFYVKINGALKITALPAGVEIMKDFVAVPGLIKPI